MRIFITDRLHTEHVGVAINKRFSSISTRLILNTVKFFHGISSYVFPLLRKKECNLPIELQKTNASYAMKQVIDGSRYDFTEKLAFVRQVVGVSWKVTISAKHRSFHGR